MAYSIHDRIQPRKKIYAVDIREMDSQIAVHDEQITQINDTLDGKIDGAYQSDDNKYLYLSANGKVIAELGPFASEGGGGGGGDSGTATKMEIHNESGWLMKTVAKDTKLSAQCSWSSTLDEIPTGAGILRVYVDGAVRQTRNVNQGTFTVTLDPYLTSAGNKNIRVSVTDVYGVSKEIKYTVGVEDFTITSPFDVYTAVQGGFTLYYTPKGTGTKTVHFKVDGTELPTETVETTDHQQSKTIPAQSHGAHTLDVWFEVEMDGENIESNHLWYEFMSVDSKSTTSIITSQYNGNSVEQYGILVLPYQAYDPTSLTAQVELGVDGETVQTITVDRTEQRWSYRPLTHGEKDFTITCRGVTKTFHINVTKSEAEIGAVTEDMSLYLTAQGRNNQEEHPETWQYNLISANLTGFNFVNDGWQLDKDGVSVLRVSGDARVAIPYKIFERDFRSTGKTIELEFSTRNVMNYDTPIFSCMSDGRGFVATSQKVSIASEQSSLETQYKEDEHVRISFVIEKRSEHRLMYCYINGILSAVTQYPDSDDFSQITPVDITIGTNDSTIDIYNIRVYDNNLTRHQILGNWIADTADVTTMMARYDRNNIFDNNNNIVIEKLPNDLPYMIVSCPQLPQYKGDKKTCSVTYTDPVNPQKSFTAENVQIDVQGTSSQYYPRKNYKLKYKGGFTVMGETVSKYQLTDDCLPANVFCMKADFASSEGANNVELVRLYERAIKNIYQTPAQEENPLVRQGIDGLPCVMFYNNGSSTEFIGKYNFNHDKSAENVFGFVDDDESWEVKTHASTRVLWKVSDFEGTGWLDDFEARFPDTDPPYIDPAQLKAFTDWIIQTDTEVATGNVLPAPVTYDGVTYSTDSAEYRLAKFRAEAGDYIEINSMLFYYISTEWPLMVDSRSKNMFPSFMGSEVNN